MKTLAVLNQKGGVGKTTISFHVGWYLAEKGERVLMVDLDPQGTLSSLFDLEGCDAQGLFLGTEGKGPVLQCHDVTKEIEGKDVKLSVVTADERLQAFEAVAGTHQNARALKKALHAFADRFTCAVIDCPPSLGGFAVNAMLAADYLLVPSTVRSFSIAGLDRVLALAQSAVEENQNPNLRVLGIVLNQFNPLSKRQTNFESEIASDLKSTHNGAVISSIPSSIKVEEALYSKLPVWRYADLRQKHHDSSVASVASAYRQFAETVAQRMTSGEGA